jgi:hypothetical protein
MPTACRPLQTCPRAGSLFASSNAKKEMQAMANSSNYWFDWRIRGIPSDIWIRFSDSIGQLITKEKLTPDESRFLTTPNQVNFALTGQVAAAAPAVAETAKSKASVTEIFDIRGGIRAAHVHYKGSIYMLNDAQWKRFSTLVVNDFKTKLEAAGAIGFDQVLDISEAAAKIA